MTPAPLTGRHYGMDWLRIAAFQLLILYHVGMAFVPWAYEVKAADPPVDLATVPMMLVNPWRLSLLFAISGYASAALLEREAGPGAFVRSRLARLGVPLLFGIAVLVAPQPWVALVTQHGYRQGFGHFYLHDYFGFRAIDGIDVPTWMHLWFVAYLLIYSLVLAALIALPAAWRAGARALAERLLAGPGLLILPALYLGLARSNLPPGWSDTHGLFDDASAHAAYLPLFLFGVLLRGSEPVRLAIARWWPVAGLCYLIGYGVLAGAEIAYPGTTPLPGWMWPAYYAFRTMALWGGIVALFGLADRYWNRDHPWRATLAEAVFPFYIIHQTIILLVGYWLLGTDTGAAARFVILVAATFLGCWAFYLVGRVIGPLRPLIGLKRRAGPSAS